VPIDNEIREDLHAMRQLVNAGQYTYAAPRTAEGHSDRCTALALAVRAAKFTGYTGALEDIQAWGRERGRESTYAMEG
jgi:phage FluMu gp28-like protein